MTAPRVYPHAQAIKARLAAANLRVGDHRAPKSADGRIVAPCVVLYMQPSAAPLAGLACTDEDVLLRFRLTAVDLTADGAEHYADRVFDAMDGATLTVANRAIFRVRRSALAAIERDDDLDPPYFYAPTPYQLLSMSA